MKVPAEFPLYQLAGNEGGKQLRESANGVAPAPYAEIGPALRSRRAYARDWLTYSRVMTITLNATIEAAKMQGITEFQRRETGIVRQPSLELRRGAVV